MAIIAIKRSMFITSRGTSSR